MRLVLISILLVSILTPRYSINAQGLSYIGICNKTWDCNKTLSTWRGEPIGWLENTFGEECSCVDKLLATKRDKVVRVHLLNGPCMRNKRCGKYEAFYGYNKNTASRAIMRGKGRLIERFKVILQKTKERLSRANGKVTCYVSPCLECDLYDRARRVLANLVSAALPNCNIVDSPNTYQCLRGLTCERHGDSPNVTKPCIVDLDGTDGMTVDLNKWMDKYQSCDLRFIWYPWMNCLGEKFVDPRNRKCI